MSLLSEKLAPLWSAINRLQARQMSIFPATVTSVDPVRIRIDGESRSLAATPANGLPVGTGERVRVIRYGTTLLIAARMNLRRQAFAQAAIAATTAVGGTDRASAGVTFPTGLFTAPPRVFADVEINPGSNPVMIANAYNIGTAVCSLRLVRADGNYSSSYTVR